MRKHESPSPQPEEKRPTFWAELYDWLETFAGVIALTVILFTFFFVVIGVNGSSMYPTLHNSDLLIVRRIGYTPKQGDIVILRKDTLTDQAIVKRIIATEGQSVEIDYETNTVYVDEVALSEDYLNFANENTIEDYGDDYMVERPGMVYSSFVVPEHSIFVMGDNRNGSTDSRYAELGMVDEGYIIGGAEALFFPFDRRKLLN